MKGTISALALALLVFSGSVVQGGEEDGTDRINATATGERGVFHVLPVFKQLTAVHVYNKKGPYGPEHTRILERGAGFTYFPNTGNLLLHVPVDVEKEHVSVIGQRVIPWAWRVRHTLVPGSVRVLLGKRIGVEGEDFAVSAAAGIFRFLKTEHCTKNLRYFIKYVEKGRPGDPGKPLYGCVGNHSDRELLRRFSAGEEPAQAPRREKPSNPVVTSVTQGLNAMPTGERGVYHMTQVFSSVKSVSVIARETRVSRPLGESEWAYDKARGRLLITVDIDDEKEMVIAGGRLATPSVWVIPKPFVAGSLRMLLGDRTAVEGEDFTVDVENRTVRLIGEAAKSGRHYYMRWLYPKDPERPDLSPSGSIGNHPDRTAVRKFISNR